MSYINTVLYQIYDAIILKIIFILWNTKKQKTLSIKL